MDEKRFVMEKRSENEWVEVATSNNREILWDYMQMESAKAPNEEYRIRGDGNAEN